MNSHTEFSATHQLWLPIPQETARPRKLPLSLNMEGENKESPALADNHQVILPEHAHSPATDHLMCSSNQTETVISTTYADMAHRLSLLQTVHCSSACGNAFTFIQLHHKDCSNLLYTLTEICVCREMKLSL